MARHTPHTHPCRACQAPVPCEGAWERNDDGFPEIICPEYHLSSGRLATVLCPEHDFEQEEE